jgi:DNA-binding NarL/FixJ family response regulator
VRILLVDDDRLLLATLSRYLTLQRPSWEVITAPDGADAIRVLRTEPVSVLVTDIQMPGVGGMALLGMVREAPALAHLPLLLMTGHSDSTTMRQGMSSGADDYLLKPFAPDELILAIEGRLRRLAVGTESAREALVLGREVKEKLTGRELDILARIGRGLVTKDIACALGLSPRTVSVHRANIMRKLDLHNAAALAALAIRVGI